MSVFLVRLDAFAFTAVAMAGLLDDLRVVLGVLVPLGAVGLSCVHRPHPPAAHDVFVGRHRAHMVGIATGGRVAREVIQVQPLGDGTILPDVGELMSADSSPTLQVKSSVSSVKESSRPQVTPCVRFGYPLFIEPLIG